MFYKMACAAGLACALAGCSGVAPTRLAPPPTKDVLELREPFSYEDGNLLGSRGRFILAPGQYQPIGDDSGGTYYLGPGYCLSSFNLDGPAPVPGAMWRCGIQVSSGMRTVKVFTVIGEAPTTTGKEGQQAPDVTWTPSTGASANSMSGAAGSAIGMGLVMAMAEAEKGNFRIFRFQPQGDSLSRALVKATPGPDSTK